MSYTYTHLEDFTQKVYENINVYEPNELNLYSIADALNIGVYPISTISQAIQSEGRQYIFLNNTLNALERFEVFGHELGHILLHAGNQQSMNKDYRSYQEWKANLFALHFCIPTFMLLQVPHRYLNQNKIGETFGVTTDFAEERLVLHRQKIESYEYTKQFQGIEK